MTPHATTTATTGQPTEQALVEAVHDLARRVHTGAVGRPAAVTTGHGIATGHTDDTLWAGLCRLGTALYRLDHGVPGRAPASDAAAVQTATWRLLGGTGGTW